MYTQEQYSKACIAVANDWRELAHKIHTEDSYASHVTQEQKDKNLSNMLQQANDIEKGYIKSFTIAQRVYEKLTGECIPLLSK